MALPQRIIEGQGVLSPHLKNSGCLGGSERPGVLVQFRKFLATQTQLFGDGLGLAPHTRGRGLPLPGILILLQFCLQEASPDYTSPASIPFSSERPWPLLPGPCRSAVCFGCLPRCLPCHPVLLVPHHSCAVSSCELGPCQFDQHSLVGPAY